MEKLVEYDPQFSFPIIFHFIPGFTQSVTIGAAREIHKELGEILKNLLPEDHAPIRFGPSEESESKNDQG